MSLVLTEFENADGEKVKDLPIAVPLLGELDADVDDADRLHEIALADLGDEPSPPAEMEPEPEATSAGADSGAAAPSGPLRQYDEAAESGSGSGHAQGRTDPRAGTARPGSYAAVPHRRRGRPPDRRPVRRYGRSTTARRPHCVR